jgi:hypothetical protein
MMSRKSRRRRKDAPRMTTATTSEVHDSESKRPIVLKRRVRRGQQAGLFDDRVARLLPDNPIIFSLMGVEKFDLEADVAVEHDPRS